MPAASPICAGSRPWPIFIMCAPAATAPPTCRQSAWAAALHFDVSIPNFGIQEWMHHAPGNRRGFPARLFLSRRRAASGRSAGPGRGDRREACGQISLQARLPAGEPAGRRQHDQLVSAMEGTMTASRALCLPRRHVRWLVCALLFAIVALNYTDRQVLSVLKPTLQKAYGWSETGYGGCGVLVPGRLWPGLCRFRPDRRPFRRARSAAPSP